MNKHANCKSVINIVKEAQREGSKSLLHLVYGPMLSGLRENKRKQNFFTYSPQKREEGSGSKHAAGGYVQRKSYSFETSK